MDMSEALGSIFRSGVVVERHSIRRKLAIVGTDAAQPAGGSQGLFLPPVADAAAGEERE